MKTSGCRQEPFRGPSQSPANPNSVKSDWGFFIEEDEVKIPGYFAGLIGLANCQEGCVYGDGNDRGFDPGMEPEDNKVYIEADFSTGRGLVFSNRSCTDKTKTRCTDARPLGTDFLSIPRQDGSVEIEFAIGNSRSPDVDFLNDIKIAASLVITPKPGTATSPQNICVRGTTTRYPSVEGYYDNNGVTYPALPDRAERLLNGGTILPPKVAS